MHLYTLKNSLIGRYRNNVGKAIGGRIYVHKDYMSEVIPSDILQVALGILPINTIYNTVVYDIKSKTIRFDEALNFDEEREPWAGRFIKISRDGEICHGRTESIWHHKWLWVKDDYGGFDVMESYNWSKTWLREIGCASGSLRVWREQISRLIIITN